MEENILFGELTASVKEFDPFSPEHESNPHGVYARYREQDPVHWGLSPTTSSGSWYLFRYEHVSRALKDARLIHDCSSLLASPPLTSAPSLPPELLASSFFRLSNHFMVSLDPPAHTRLRGLVSKAFSVGVVESLRNNIEQIANELLEEIVAKHKRGKQTFDLLEDYAGPLPLRVIAAMLGAPVENYLKFREWSRSLSATIEAVTPEILSGAIRASDEMVVFLGEIIKARKIVQKDDLISRMVNAEENGAMLTEDELMATCMLLLVAGHETTTNLIGNGVHALLAEEDQLSLLREKPELIRNAVEEVLRYDSPGRIAVRWAKEDFVIGGKQIKRGDRVALVVASANRDTQVFENANQLVIERDASKHLAFGMGMHYCIGAPLARMEGEIAFRNLLEKLPNFKLAKKELQWQKRVSIRGLETLPLSLE